MEKIISMDKQGRLYIPEDIRKMLQIKTFVIKSQDNGMFLEPIEDDPIEALGNLGREKLKNKSIKQLKKEAREDIVKNVF